MEGPKVWREKQAEGERAHDEKLICDIRNRIPRYDLESVEPNRCLRKTFCDPRTTSVRDSDSFLDLNDRDDVVVAAVAAARGSPRRNHLDSYLSHVHASVV